MKLYQKILGAGAIVLALGLTGCITEPLEGIVKEEFGTAATLTDSRGPLLENNLIKQDDLTYGIVLETADGTYTLNVRHYRRKPVLAVAKAVEPGDRIRINPDCNTEIGKDNIGTTDSDTISIIEKNRNKPAF